MGKSPGKKILLIEDDAEETLSVRAMFNDESSYAFELTCVECMSEAEEYLAGHSVDIVLLDLGLSDPKGLEAFRRVRAYVPRISIVLLSSLDDEPIAVRAVQEGAHDYFIKGQLEPQNLRLVLCNATERELIEEVLFHDRGETAQIKLARDADAQIFAGMSGNIILLNSIAERMTGWSLKESAGRPLSEVFRIVDATNRKAILDPVANGGPENRGERLHLNCLLIHRDGHEFLIEHSVSLVRNHEGEAAGAVIVFRDLSSRRAQPQRFSHAAEHDLLTGLPNRLLLYDRVGQAISLAQQQREYAAVLFLNLDSFEQITGSLGRRASDKLLQSVATRLRDCLRNPDTVSRLEGDEFVVLLQHVHRTENAAATAARLLQAVAASHFIDHKELHVTASIGVSVCPDDGLDAETLIRNADDALQHAKKNGIHSYQFYRPEIKVNAVDHQSVEQGLGLALERNELALHYQPKINLKSGAISGTEALARWIHPTIGSVPPGKFIPIAEESGLILRFGSWVLCEACLQARAWADSGVPVKAMAVNVAGTQFQSEGFLVGLFAILGATGWDPEFLELDVTENVLLTNPERTAFILKTLKDRGVQVSVDNFGTGNSNASSLQKFPLHALKIDRSLVRQITTVPDGTTIVRSIIGMGRSLNLRVIAQGVETAEDLEFLWEYDCDEAQGNFFSRPVPPEQLASLMQPKQYPS
jgi:diguanylate cyclase (GGDEF)-like protein/PAS domain S-box-containing protein